MLLSETRPLGWHRELIVRLVLLLELGLGIELSRQFIIDVIIEDRGQWLSSLGHSAELMYQQVVGARYKLSQPP